MDINIRSVISKFSDLRLLRITKSDKHSDLSHPIRSNRLRGERECKDFGKVSRWWIGQKKGVGDLGCTVPE